MQLTSKVCARHVFKALEKDKLEGRLHWSKCTGDTLQHQEASVPRMSRT